MKKLITLAICLSASIAHSQTIGWKIENIISSFQEKNSEYFTTYDSNNNIIINLQDTYSLIAYKFDDFNICNEIIILPYKKYENLVLDEFYFKLKYYNFNKKYKILSENKYIYLVTEIKKISDLKYIVITWKRK